VAILGGSQYLPESADLLQIMIWYMPIGFINSVTQYVLIALDRQRYLTRAFGVGLAFSALANLAGIALWGYRASAYVMVAAELVLLTPFYIGVRRYLAPIPWAGLLWRIAASAIPLVALPALLPGPYRAVGLAAGLALYGAGLWLLGAYDAEERDALARVLPVRRVATRLGLWRG